MASNENYQDEQEQELEEVQNENNAPNSNETNTSISTGTNNQFLSNVPKMIILGILLAFVFVVVYSMNAKNQAQVQSENTENTPLKTAEQTNAQSEVLKHATYKRPKAPSDFEQPNKNKNVEKYGIDTNDYKDENGNIKKITHEEAVEIVNKTPRKLEVREPAQIIVDTKDDPRWQQFEQMRSQQFMQAMTAKPAIKKNGTINNSKPEKPASNASYQQRQSYYDQELARIQALKNRDPNAAYAAAKAQAMQLAGEFSTKTTTANNSGTKNNTSSANNDSNSTNRWKLQSQVENSTPYTLTTGFVIPAVMITGINSDLAGSIIAQVSQNVYDTSTGRHLLIPQGTKLFGTYGNQIQFGQERVLVAWNRLVFPNGKTLDLGQMLGADMAGFGGFTDQVNNHFWKLFKGAFLLSMVTASVTYADNKYNTGNSEAQSATSAMSESLGQELGQVTTELIRKHMNISPTLEIRQGYRFNVIISKDITFDRPYR